MTVNFSFQKRIFHCKNNKYVILSFLFEFIFNVLLVYFNNILSLILLISSKSTQIIFINKFQNILN
jgi:hypothetical protein